MQTKEIFKELKSHRDLIEKLAPCGLTPEEAWEDKTLVQINASRALMVSGFQSQIQLLLMIKKDGKLLK